MIRKDIQGLRAIAVLAVLMFHFWPDRLPGGYVGVDVFFVISGFLITSHLLRKPPVTRKMLVDFWARRIKRLIPAATLVLFVTVIASIIWLPETMLQRTLHEAAAAAVYGENWMLAINSTDYLASEDAPTPIQHYWSLSIEEQYYAVWPIVIGSVFILGRRLLTTNKLLVASMGAIFVASLLYSIYLTSADSAAAYFVTTTRIWELTIGGLVALMASKASIPSRAAVPMAWVGLAMISATVVIFTKETPFPSYTALLPTVGTALVILAAADNMKWSPRRLLGWRPSQFMGDISYSVYLWHWPVVVIAPFALGVEYLTLSQKITLILGVIGLSYLTKIWVEDPVRSSTALMRTNLRTFAYGLASIAIVATLALGVSGTKQAQAAEAQKELEYALSSKDCVGAAVMRDDECGELKNQGLLMTPEIAREDRSVLYEDKCWNNRPYDGRKVCSYGDLDSQVRVALIGNSHAGMWHAALDEASVNNGWRLDTYLVSECYNMTKPISFTTQALTDNCRSWNDWAISEASNDNYDAVVMSNRTFRKLKDIEEKHQFAEQKLGYTDTINTFLDAGKKVFVIRDSPEAVENIPDCLSKNGNHVNACTGDRARVLIDDPLYEAARMHESRSVYALDLSDRFCDKSTCYSIIGGLIVYFDHGHITDSYVRTLTPDIEDPLVKFIESN